MINETTYCTCRKTSSELILSEPATVIINSAFEKQQQAVGVGKLSAERSLVGIKRVNY